MIESSLSWHMQEPYRRLCCGEAGDYLGSTPRIEPHVPPGTGEGSGTVSTAPVLRVWELFRRSTGLDWATRDVARRRPESPGFIHGEGQSAITLLRDEESIAPLYQALRRFLFSAAEDAFFAMALDSHPMKRARQRCQSLEALREATDIPMVVRAFILQEDYPEEFREIAEQFIAIFDTVEDVRLGKLGELAPAILADVPPFATEWLTLAIQERGVQGWITVPCLSAGMRRILMHLLELALASPGTVIVIDEFENSLGVNCLPALSDLLLDRSRDLQFILTSHHPYVINNIPATWWKVVTRQGGVVTVKDAESIPALQTASSHEKFLQLMNLQEYEAGIA